MAKHTVDYTTSDPENPHAPVEIFCSCGWHADGHNQFRQPLIDRHLTLVTGKIVTSG